MSEPRTSEIWSDAYFGPSAGNPANGSAVDTGPFAQWAVAKAAPAENGSSVLGNACARCGARTAHGAPRSNPPSLSLSRAFVRPSRLSLSLAS
jgi:hypothetical protein